MKLNIETGLALLFLKCASLAYAENSQPQLPKVSVNMNFCERTSPEEVQCFTKGSAYSSMHPRYLFHKDGVATEFLYQGCGDYSNDCTSDKIVYRINAYGKLDSVTEITTRFVGNKFKQRVDLKSDDLARLYSLVDSRTGEQLSLCLEYIKDGSTHCSSEIKESENNIKDGKLEKLKLYSKRFNTIKREFSRYYKPKN